MKLEFTRGPKVRPPPRIVVYGDAGVGKTTLGANAPNSVIVPTEDGALGADAPLMPKHKVKTWQELLDTVRSLLVDEHDRQWVVIDTINGASTLCAQHVCNRDFGGRWESIRGAEGYNAWARGPKETAREIVVLLDLLDGLQQKRDMGVMLLAHAAPVKQSNMFGADFYESAPSLDKPVLEIVKAWADQIAYAGREVRAATRDGERRAKVSMVSDARHLWFEGQPGIVAKNRIGYEMPARILLDWDTYEAELNRDHTSDFVAQALEMCGQADETAHEIVRKRLGGEISSEALEKIGVKKLQALIGWLLKRSEA